MRGRSAAWRYRTLGAPDTLQAISNERGEPTGRPFTACPLPSGVEDVYDLAAVRREQHPLAADESVTQRNRRVRRRADDDVRDALRHRMRYGGRRGVDVVPALERGA